MPCVDFDNACWPSPRTHLEEQHEVRRQKQLIPAKRPHYFHIICMCGRIWWYLSSRSLLTTTQLSKAVEAGRHRRRGTLSPCLQSAAKFTSTTWGTDCRSLASVPSWHVIYLISWLEVHTQPTLSKKQFSSSVNSQILEAFLTPNQSRRQTAINHSSEQDWAVSLTSLI